jgi:hypothetical protein
MSAPRRRRSRAPLAKNARIRRCAICGSTKDVQDHHLGGRKHAAYFTLPLCCFHHEAVTIALARVRINMQYTSDEAERSRRARMAAYIFLWFLDEAIQTKQ